MGNVGNDQIRIVDLRIQALKSDLKKEKEFSQKMMQDLDIEGLYQAMEELTAAIRRYEKSSERGAKSELKALYNLRKETRAVMNACEEKLDEIDRRIERISDQLTSMRRMRTILYARVHQSPLAGEEVL